MNNPLRRDRENLTTADIAGAQQPDENEILEARPRLVQSEPNRERTEKTGTEGIVQSDQHPTPLFPENERGEMQANWSRIQTAFVDEPKRAVEEADTLVASTMKRLAEVFSSERAKLEQQWDHGDNISTEDLRLSLQRYRSFFHRLLAI